jgi:hypothetical protein
MRRIHWLLAGLALSIGAGALAQVVPGGLPAVPTFQGINISPASTTGPTSVIRAEQQIAYSLLGPKGTGRLGPGIQARWDGATANRYLSFGFYDNSNVYSETARLWDGANGGAWILPLACSTACQVGSMHVGQWAEVVKPSSTARISTTTATADPDLQFLNVPTGTYRFWLSTNFSTGAGGYRDFILGMNTFSLGGVTNCAGVATSAVLYQGSMLNVCATSSGGGEEYSGTFTVTGPTTVSYQWAQNSNVATNSFLTNTGTSFTLFRLQ